ncbi:hypothetical protein N431DRAFT_557134 [Stipitochalara longipes BDJ]|nr:hypothetical protein N431DRAFT_557134 [Stipitochalara longipes BDJ]
MYYWGCIEAHTCGRKGILLDDPPHPPFGTSPRFSTKPQAPVRGQICSASIEIFAKINPNLKLQPNTAKMPWKEVAPGLYERPLDGIENTCRLMRDLFVPLSGGHNWEMNFVSKLRFAAGLSEADIITGLRSAWIQTRYQHPLIAGLLRGSNHVYEIPKDQAAVDKWLKESFVVHRETTVRDWFRSVGILSYSTVHFFPASSQLVLRLHHWQADGMGALYLLDRYLSYFSSGDHTWPRFGDEAPRLAPAQDEAGPLPPSSEPHVREAAQKLFNEHPALRPSVGLEIKPCPPAGCASERLSVPSPALDGLLAASKKAGYSLTSAVHAAVIAATYTMAWNETAGRDFTSMNFFNYRPYVQRPYADTKTWATGCWMTATPFTLPPGDFDTYAKSLQLLYHQPLSINEWVHAKHYGTYTAIFADLLSTPLPEGVVPPPQTCPQLSSLGRIDDKVQHEYKGKRGLSVEDVELDMNIMAPGFMVYQWSWKGTFFLSASYNEGFYDREYVQLFLANVKANLFKGLALPEPTAS